MPLRLTGHRGKEARTPLAGRGLPGAKAMPALCPLPREFTCSPHANSLRDGSGAGGGVGGRAETLLGSALTQEEGAAILTHRLQLEKPGLCLLG